MLFTTLLGNDPSTSIAARLVGLELPPSYAAGFPGPSHGVDGWRRLTGVYERPLLLNMIKPCTGYPASVGARFVREVALGGVDLVKDDELLADPAFAPVADRAAAYRSALEDVAEETGHRARYVANVTTRLATLVDTAVAALAAGADAIMVNVFAVGLDGLAMLAEASLGVPILAHTAGVETLTGGRRAGFGQAVLLGDLVRLAGADAILLSTPYASRPLDRALYGAIVERMRRPAGPVLPAMPMVGGGLTANHVAALVRDLGPDALLAVGGAIQGHPEGAAAGARAVRAAIDAAVAGPAASVR
jgi:2,3-diketo-5-methylthiopentyl-1-phosphate enolase